VHSVTYSLLWVRCLFDLISISNFRGKWPLSENFRKCFSNEFTFRDQIWWKSAVAKLPKGRVVYQTKKTRAPRDSSQPPFLARMGRSCPKFPKRCHPLTCPRIPNLVRIGCRLPDLFRKDWSSGPLVKMNGLRTLMTSTLWTTMSEELCLNATSHFNPAGEHRWAQESFAVDMGPAATRLDQESHIELPKKTSGLCESWWWTHRTYAKMNYLWDFRICNNSQCFFFLDNENYKLLLTIPYRIENMA